jgi:hypothetical protein
MQVAIIIYKKNLFLLTMKMLRTPLPHAHVSKIERCGSAELFGLFETCLKTGVKPSPYSLLSDAWGRLFASIFLSPEELMDEMQQEGCRFRDDHENMLREFIKADCASGGAFVIDVITSGGKMERAALIMITDLEDLAGVEYKGITGIQLLIEACDKKVRPILIRRAGKHLLSRVYDRRGLPLIFSIFGLCDINAKDLDAIDSVFSRDELRTIMSRNRTGNNALEVFTNLSAAMKRYPSMDRNKLERNAFYIPAAKEAKEEAEEQPVRIGKISPVPQRAQGNKSG